MSFLSESFLTASQVESIRERFGTPVYVYDQKRLETAAEQVLAFPAPCRLVGRFAMKALPTAAVLRVLTNKGLHIDASSGFEAERALIAGIAPERIQITAQEIPKDLKGLVQRGVLFNACSLHQLRTFGQIFPGAELSVRINPGKGSGHNNRTNVGGPGSSFGIWHEKIEEVHEIAREFDLHLTGMHTHIGSGGDPEIWKHCAALTLEIAAQLPELKRLSLGGGFKVARVAGEKTADLQEIGAALHADLEAFVSTRGGRDFQLEIEPGTYLVANAGVILAEIIDIVDTFSSHRKPSNQEASIRDRAQPAEVGYRFLKIDSGMTELLRPALYGAQHPFDIVSKNASFQPASHEASDRETVPYLIAGHCCESGDILTPAPGDPEGLAPRPLPLAEIGDTLVIGGAGAYASGLAGKNYNSFPEAAEVLLDRDGNAVLIRTRQTLQQSIQNEIRS